MHFKLGMLVNIYVERRGGTLITHIFSTLPALLERIFITWGHFNEFVNMLLSCISHTAKLNHTEKSFVKRS